MAIVVPPIVMKILLRKIEFFGHLGRLERSEGEVSLAGPASNLNDQVLRSGGRFSRRPLRDPLCPLR
ncbi:MAG: hypothetical protein DMF75_11205 [Acidobacteria bacterium]|nr:MAG: hypothetical protein DMF75_11205 [Acidobacteriota bacterium]